MAKLEVADAISRAQTYPHAVLAYVGPDGYPVNIAVDFTGVGRRAPPSTSARSHQDLRPADGQEVELTFSHIRPQPGVGYDERRYVNLWGPATPTGARACGWRCAGPADGTRPTPRSSSTPSAACRPGATTSTSWGRGPG